MDSTKSFNEKLEAQIKGRGEYDAYGIGYQSGAHWAREETLREVFDLLEFSEKEHVYINIGWIKQRLSDKESGA